MVYCGDEAASMREFVKRLSSVAATSNGKSSHRRNCMLGAIAHHMQECEFIFSAALQESLLLLTSIHHMNAWNSHKDINTISSPKNSFHGNNNMTFSQIQSTPKL